MSYYSELDAAIREAGTTPEELVAALPVCSKCIKGREILALDAETKSYDVLVSCDCGSEYIPWPIGADGQDRHPLACDGCGAVHNVLTDVVAFRCSNCHGIGVEEVDRFRSQFSTSGGTSNG